MKADILLYETVYQSMLTQLYSGVLRCGQSLPSQQELCRQYHVGITTIRKVLGMLEKNGFIRTAPGKRAVVCFGENNLGFISALLRRSESILDVYGGLELLMPAFCTAGALLTRDFRTPEQILHSFAQTSDPYILSLKNTCFFTQFLLPLRNPVLMDLQADMEHYARIPCLPDTGLTNPFTAACFQARTSLQDILMMAEKKQDAALNGRLRQMYHDMGTQLAVYMGELEAMYPCSREKDSYQWFSSKSRANLYTMVARSLFKRTEQGEFDCRPYLPSVPQIMKEYQISKSTASNAVALLSDIGFVHILDKKGIVLRRDEPLPPIRFDSKVITEHLLYFLDVLQILAICAVPLSSAAFSSLRPEEKRETGRQWQKYGKSSITIHIVQILLSFLKRNIPWKCLKNILGQFDDILIWGHYLNRMPQDNKAFFLDDQIRKFFASLHNALLHDDEKTFVSCFHSLFSVAYHIPRMQLLHLMPDPDGFPASLS